MCPQNSGKLTAAEVLKKYTEDNLPMFLGRPIEDVNQVAADGDRPIHVACIRGNFEEALALVEAGADVNAAGDLGNTPLHIVGSRGLADIARLLLNHGADVTVKNEFGQTPLDLANLMTKDEVAEILMSAKNARS